MAEINPHTARQGAIRSIHTVDILGETLHLASCKNKNFQIIVRSGFEAPKSLSAAEADEFVRMSCLHFTSRNTEARARNQFAGDIPNLTRKSNDPTLIYIAQKTGALLFTPTGEQCDLNNWHSFTDLGGHMGLHVAKKVNMWADVGKISEEQRIFFLERLDLSPNHDELYRLPKGHAKYPSKEHTAKSKSIRGLSAPALKRQKRCNEEEAKDEAINDVAVERKVICLRVRPAHAARSKAKPEVKADDENVKMPIAGAGWPANELRGVNGDALTRPVALDPNNDLTVRETAHVVRGAMRPALRRDLLFQMARIFSEMAMGDYNEPDDR